MLSTFPLSCHPFIYTVEPPMRNGSVYQLLGLFFLPFQSTSCFSPPPPAVATCLPNLSLVLMILVLFPPAFFSLIHWCKCMDMYTWFYSSLLILSHLYSHSFILLLFISQNLLQLFPNFFQVTFKYSLKIKTWHISLKGLSNLPLLSENLPLPAN